jgi:putative heme-binding domain-containing protein
LFLDDLVKAGSVDSRFREQLRGEPTPSPDAGAVADKARSWLHVNCSHCHRQNAGGAVTMMLNADLTLPQMQAIDVAPLQGGLGLTDPKLIDAGNPWNSAICVRIAKAGSGHMPVIGPREVDVEGLKLIEDWISRMGNQATSSADLLPKEWSEPLLKAKLATVEGAMQALRAMDDGLIKEPLRQKALDLAWSSPQPTVRDLFDRFLPDDKRVATLGMNPDAKKILALQGDPARGAQLLSPQGKLAACFACHLINGAGRDFGPDLSKIATRLKPEQMLESLLHPSKVIAQGYQTASVETNDGAVQVGFIVKDNAGGVSVRTATGQTVTVEKSNIRNRSNLPASLMPEGLAQGLTAREAADLLSYLNSLK